MSAALANPLGVLGLRVGLIFPDGLKKAFAKMPFCRDYKLRLLFVFMGLRRFLMSLLS